MQNHLARSSGYRADIDGLRAIAILAVVGFHAFPGYLPGGFTGVDVFFVISGFLISGIIFEELQAGRFSYAGFYGRRVRRIFPALIVVLLACFTAGWFALANDEYKALGKHMAAGAAFVSNLALWSEAGYFDAAAETKPLLHLWSLGIEEQFYVFWPLLAGWAWRRRLNLLAIEVSHRCGVFVVDIDKIFAHVGARQIETDFRLAGRKAAETAGYAIVAAILAGGLDNAAPPQVQEMAIELHGPLSDIGLVVGRRLAQAGA